MKTLKNHREKMSIRANVHMSKIMSTPIKLGVRTYLTYVNCQTLDEVSNHQAKNVKRFGRSKAVD